MPTKPSVSTEAVLAGLPDKVFFRIGEVSKRTGVKTYVLRYWETEFPLLKPKKSRSGQRLYRRGDIEAVLRIRELLWDRRFTIAGARAELGGRGASTPSEPPKDEEELATIGPDASRLAPAAVAPTPPSVVVHGLTGRQRSALTRARGRLLQVRADLSAIKPNDP